jgi:hypothetical protein
MLYGLAFLFLIERELYKISTHIIYGFFELWITGGSFPVAFQHAKPSIYLKQ